MPSIASSLRTKLFAPVDASSLAVCRIAFGLLMLGDIVRFAANGWIQAHYIDPTFHFTYPGFSWVQPWPGLGMHLHFFVLGLLAFCIAIGLWYRCAAALFWLGFTYVFLIDQALYLNHFYLIVLVSGLMVFLPAAQVWSVDAMRQRASRAKGIPWWPVALLRFQIGITYLLAAVAKLNPDWLRGQPMQLWLRHLEFPLLDTFFLQPWAGLFFSYTGLAMDAAIVPLLLYKHTRLAGFALVIIFNLFNAVLFNIGVFPWFMIAMSTIFFAPDWPRTMLKCLGVPTKPALRTAKHSPERAHQSRTLILLTIYCTLQILIPLRHFAYPGNVHWTEQGHRFAWHMKLRSKQGDTNFTVHDLARDRTWEVHEQQYLTSTQQQGFTGRPEMILQLAHHLREEYARSGIHNPAVYVDAHISLNGRPKQSLIDPHVNLSDITYFTSRSAWVLPLETPLR